MSEENQSRYSLSSEDDSEEDTNYEKKYNGGGGAAKYAKPKYRKMTSDSNRNLIKKKQLSRFGLLDRDNKTFANRMNQVKR